MANRIAGITVEIGGDTTKLSSALKSVNSEIKTTQSQMKDAVIPAAVCSAWDQHLWYRIFRILKIPFL